VARQGRRSSATTSPCPPAPTSSLSSQVRVQGLGFRVQGLGYGRVTCMTTNATAMYVTKHPARQRETSLAATAISSEAESKALWGRYVRAQTVKPCTKHRSSQPNHLPIDPPPSRNDLCGARGYPLSRACTCYMQGYFAHEKLPPFPRTTAGI